jgi:hypothetical protein
MTAFRASLFMEGTEKTVLFVEHAKAKAAERGDARLAIPANIAKAGDLAAAYRQSQQMEFVAGLVPIIQAIRSTGAITLRDMASALNQRGIRSARGGKWHVSSVMNLLARSSAIPSSPALS